MIKDVGSALYRIQGLFQGSDRLIEAWRGVARRLLLLDLGVAAGVLNAAWQAVPTLLFLVADTLITEPPR